jgi:hypothetical protein
VAGLGVVNLSVTGVASEVADSVAIGEGLVIEAVAVSVAALVVVVVVVMEVSVVVIATTGMIIQVASG